MKDLGYEFFEGFLWLGSVLGELLSGISRFPDELTMEGKELVIRRNVFVG